MVNEENHSAKKVWFWQIGRLKYCEVSLVEVVVGFDSDPIGMKKWCAAR
jgi:hypothetical protein